MANYVLLESIELNADVFAVTFSNIPQTGYTDLKLVLSTRGSDSSGDLSIKINGSSANLSRKVLRGNGSAASSTSASDDYIGVLNPSSYIANTFSSNEIYIPNYNSTSTYKSILADSVQENNGTAATMVMEASLWSSNSAITSITFYPYTSGNIAQYSTFSLYGLAAVGTTPAIAPKASGGNITTDGTYWYHTFLSTGAFVPQTGLTCSVLQVAGGGGGGCDIGGGGGAGGVLGFASQSFSATSQTVQVGAGGAGGNTGVKGTSGVNSQVGSITASVGGGGAGGNQGGANALSGGSGGGAGYASGTGGTASPSGQGNAGGNSGGNGAAGGGGYGSVGASGTSSNNGAIGGSSTSTVTNLSSVSGWLSITGVGVSGTFAGGGGGASGANTTPGAGGGGGAGQGNFNTNNSSGGKQNGVDAVINTGSGGGGGSSYAGLGGAGGSGFVIIRYPIA